jgi:long-chain acyl-CoA synthetase
VSGKRTIASLWDEAVAEPRTSPAYLVEESDGSWREVSWSEAAQAVDELAHGLIALGVRKGDAFGILAHTRLEWSLFDFALAHLGAVAAPIYPSSSARECRHILEDSEATGVLVEGDDELALIEEARALPHLRHVLTFADLDDLRTRGREHAAQHPHAVEEAAARIDEDDLFTFIYTSGTTGPPKGCMILNRNYFEMVRAAVLVRDFFRPTDTLLLYLPLAHNFGRFMHLLGPRIGMTVAFCPDPRRLAEVMPVVRPTIMPTVPRVLEKVHTAVTASFEEATGLKRRLIDWALRVGRRVSSLRQAGEEVRPTTLAVQHRLADKLVYSKVKARLGGRMRALLSGGAPLAKEIAEFFHTLDLLILEGYGQTEGTTASNCNLPDRYRFGTVGPALPNIEVQVADDGEILVRGPTVFAGYFRNEEATRDVLRNGWLHTGDVGALDADGFLVVTDRKKDIIVTAGGKNVSPQNIENLLKASPFISQALVIGDRRPFVSALITLDEEETAKWAHARGLDGDVQRLAGRDEVRELIQGVVDDVNSELAHFQQVRAFTVLPRDFSPEDDEVTPTLKLRRRIVEEHFRDEIEALYSPREARQNPG